MEENIEKNLVFIKKKQILFYFWLSIINYLII
jgi:hypothetical protein